jgi:hypothetical protein
MRRNTLKKQLTTYLAIRLFSGDGDTAAGFPLDALGFKDVGNYLLDNMAPDIDLPPEIIDGVKDNRLA